MMTYSSPPKEQVRLSPNEKEHGTAEGVIARALNVFANVEPGEAVTALLMTFAVFSLLTAYYLLKTAREPLILLEGGAELKSYIALGQSILLIPIVAGYTWIARKVGRLKLLAGIYLFFAMNLVLFAIMARAHAKIGVVFFLWVGIFNGTAIAQFWSFANDIYTEEQGKRLFAIIGIGSSVGAVAGAKIAELLIKVAGTSMLMIVAAVILIGCIAIMGVVEARVSGKSVKEEAKDAEKKDEKPIVDTDAVRKLFKDKYLLLISGLTIVLNCVNKTGEYMLDREILKSVAHDEKLIGAVKADYFWWINLVGVLLQLFAVSRILKYLGVRGALFCLPIVSGIGYAASFVAPVFAIVRLAKIGENAVDYSVQSTANQTLYLVTDRTEKYVGKTAIDTFVVRFGDAFSSGFVFVGKTLALSTRAFAGINLVVLVLWVVIVLAISRENKRRSDEGKGEHRGGHEPELQPA
ncbi:MAG TPA: Npt1/Npt2 family nucleotide transporter [Polyangiaceae bacterium]